MYDIRPQNMPYVDHAGPSHEKQSIDDEYCKRTRGNGTEDNRYTCSSNKRFSFEYVHIMNHHHHLLFSKGCFHHTKLGSEVCPRVDKPLAKLDKI